MSQTLLLAIEESIFSECLNFFSVCKFKRLIRNTPSPSIPTATKFCLYKIIERTGFVNSGKICIISEWFLIVNIYRPFEFVAIHNF